MGEKPDFSNVTGAAFQLAGMAAAIPGSSLSSIAVGSALHLARGDINELLDTSKYAGVLKATGNLMAANAVPMPQQDLGANPPRLPGSKGELGV